LRAATEAGATHVRKEGAQDHGVCLALLGAGRARCSSAGSTTIGCAPFRVFSDLICRTSQWRAKEPAVV
jgi:hypothetical protein